MLPIALGLLVAALVGVLLGMTIQPLPEPEDQPADRLLNSIDRGLSAIVEDIYDESPSDVRQNLNNHIRQIRKHFAGTAEVAPKPKIAMNPE